MLIEYNMQNGEYRAIFDINNDKEKKDIAQATLYIGSMLNAMGLTHEWHIVDIAENFPTPAFKGQGARELKNLALPSTTIELHQKQTSRTLEDPQITT
ncbi:hypothetical protein AMTR_s00104p00123150 [Amborella trichopoda]|uniref:Uncharacterized protein n=1 Tax=Amborella trichopoda TaxID=13333 RepID=W1NYC2_AMBTC|nr:hypothetical protein AMTR_s00104p00123150 [Amborella trichopoda]